jgi:hypothetical protein
MKQGLLSLRFADHELDVLYNEHISIPEFATEFLGFLLSDRSHELVGKLLAADVDHLEAVFGSFVSYGLRKMGFAQARSAVDEKRIVVLAWFLCRAQGGGIGQPIGAADDEAAEVVSRVGCGWQQSALWHLCALAAGYLAVADLELNVQFLPRNSHQHLLDQGVQTFVQPFLGKGAGCSNNKSIPLVADPYGILKPRFEIRFADLNLKGAFAGLPGLLSCSQTPPLTARKPCSVAQKIQESRRNERQTTGPDLPPEIFLRLGDVTYNCSPSRAR